MKKSVKLFAFVIIIFGCNTLIIKPKSLPNNMVISGNGTRLITSVQPATGLYNLDELNTIELNFNQSNWWQLLTNNYNSKTDILATLIYGGKTYEGVGVRFRGQTSYQMVINSQKKSFNISIDFTDTNLRLEGYKTLNLNNCFEDPSFIREVLYNHFVGQNTTAPKANFIKLMINGENWGVYANVQQINGEFYKEWFQSNDGTSWRAEYPDTSTQKKPPRQGNPGFGAGYCSLNYLGDNPLVYSSYYTLKSTSQMNPWEILAIACYKLNNLPVELLYDSLKYYFDVDRCLWQIANEIIFTDDDGYVNKGGMDYYVYYDIETNRIQPIEFDGNSSFETKSINWSLFLKETDTKYPLINRLLANSQLKQRYVAHTRTILNNFLNDTLANSLIDKHRALIENEVLTDEKKIYTYAQFTSSITEIKNFFANRRTNLLNNNMLKAEPPVISSVKFISDKGAQQAPSSYEEVTVQAVVSSSSGTNEVLLYYGTGLMGHFNSIQLYDDGKHNDGTLNDGIYGISIPPYPTGTYIRFYIEARSANSYNTSVFSPEGAEHDVYFYQVQPEIEKNSNIVINELMASNTSTITDPQGEFDDWIELYNKGNNDVDLSGMYLSDKIDDLLKWQFPDNTVLKANDYLIVWVDENGKDSPGLHANFKLSANGEIVVLTDNDARGNAVLDTSNFGIQDENISFGRYPNGTGSSYKMRPTPLAYNESPFSIVESNLILDNTVINIYPNPVNNLATIKLNIEKGIKMYLSIVNTLGQVYYFLSDKWFEPGSYNFKINMEYFPNGIYYFQFGNGIKFISKKFLIIK